MDMHLSPMPTTILIMHLNTIRDRLIENERHQLETNIRKSECESIDECSEVVN